tara:strand:- start:960 stop:2207 length:1248 start_codon:yes stop_codon:yes gene_type:complete
MEDNKVEEVVTDQVDSTTTEKPIEEKVKVKRRPSMKKKVIDDIIKVDLSKPKEEDIVEEEQQEPVAEEPTTDEAVGEQNPESEPEQKSEEQVSEDEQDSVLSEITEEEGEEKKQEVVEEKTEELAEEVKEAVQEQKETGIELPENIQKVVDFMNETGGSLEDYVKINQDYSKLDDNFLLNEYYRQTKPHLTGDEINFLMEDSFSFDEEVDEPRDIKRKKLAFKEQVADAKNYLDGLKSKYYEEIKLGSKLAPEQQKAIDFFNRYNKETEESQKLAEKQKSVFLNKTNQVFNEQFKGFEYNVGEKKYRFNVKEANKVKETQSDINNFVKKFLNKNNEVEDAKGYHKSLFTAMNPDAVAKHFYEQGKADAIKDSVTKSKNINMGSRQGLQEIEAGGMKVKVLGDDSSSFKFKIKNKK